MEPGTDGETCGHVGQYTDPSVPEGDWISAERVSSDAAFEKESASSGESGTFDQRYRRPRGVFRQQLFLPSVQASLRSSSAEVSENAAVKGSDFNIISSIG